jgi:hypothetical protein
MYTFYNFVEAHQQNVINENFMRLYLQNLRDFLTYLHPDQLFIIDYFNLLRNLTNHFDSISKFLNLRNIWKPSDFFVKIAIQAYEIDKFDACFLYNKLHYKLIKEYRGVTSTLGRLNAQAFSIDFQPKFDPFQYYDGLLDPNVDAMIMSNQFSSFNRTAVGHTPTGLSVHDSPSNFSQSKCVIFRNFNMNISERIFANEEERKSFEVSCDFH